MPRVSADESFAGSPSLAGIYYHLFVIKICTHWLLLDFLGGCIFCVVRLNGARPPEPTDIPLRA